MITSDAVTLPLSDPGMAGTARIQVIRSHPTQAGTVLFDGFEQELSQDEQGDPVTQALRWLLDDWLAR